MQRDARYSRGLNVVESNDPYDMEDFAMPLQEYINHPVAWDIVHNGATFQVLQHEQCVSLVEAMSPLVHFVWLLSVTNSSSFFLSCKIPYNHPFLLLDDSLST